MSSPLSLLPQKGLAQRGPPKCHMCGKENCGLQCVQCKLYFCDQDWPEFHKGKRQSHIPTPLTPVAMPPLSLPSPSFKLKSINHIEPMDVSDNVQQVKAPQPVQSSIRPQQAPPRSKSNYIIPPASSSSFFGSPAPSAMNETATTTVTLSSRVASATTNKVSPPPPASPTSHIPMSISLAQISAFKNSSASRPVAPPLCKICGSDCATDRYCKNCSNSFCEECFTKFHKPAHRSMHKVQLFEQLTPGSCFNLFGLSCISNVLSFCYEYQ